MRNEIVAFNVVNGGWREVDTDVAMDVMTLDENTNVLLHNPKNGKFYSSGVRGSVTSGYKSKTFFLSYNRATIVWYVHVTYKSGQELTLNLYADGGGTPVKVLTLPASGSEITKRLTIKIRAKSFALEILEPEGSPQSVEIHRISIQHD